MMQQQKDKPTSKHGVALIRVSDDSNQSTQSQRLPIESWASKHGVHIVRWYDDAGSRDKASLRNERMEFKKLLQHVETGALDDQFIVVDHSDRFGTKHSFERGKFYSLLLEHDVELWSVSEGELTSTDEISILKSDLAAMQSKKEQREKAHRTIRGKVDKARLGEWSGARIPPYGYDVGCFSPSGELKWQVHYVEMRDERIRQPDGSVVKVYHHVRHKIYLDGKVEVFAGQRNFPAKDRGDRWFIVPSSDVRRQALIRDAFNKFATETWSMNALAQWINKTHQVSPPGGGPWSNAAVIKILRNPSYWVGTTVWNKHGFARHLEWVGGNYSEVKTKRDQPVPTKRKAQEDWIAPPPEHSRALVSKELFDAVQAKLDTRQGKRAQVFRSTELWLADLMFCAKCGQRMYGYSFVKPAIYHCSTWKKHGSVNNPTGCQQNRVDAPLAESIVEEFLEEAGEKVKTLLQAQRSDPAFLDELKGELTGKAREAIEAWQSMKRFVEKVLGQHMATQPAVVQDFIRDEILKPASEATEPPDAEEDGILDLYRAFFTRQKESLAINIAALERQFEDSFRSYKTLKSKKAQDLANAEMEELEAKIGVLKAEQENLAERYKSLCSELEHYQTALSQAQAALAGDCVRQKADAVRRVVAQIVCHFEDVPGATLRRPKSKLVKVEVFPVEGLGLNTKVVMPNITGRPPGLIRMILRAEMDQAKLAELQAG